MFQFYRLLKSMFLFGITRKKNCFCSFTDFSVHEFLLCSFIDFFVHKFNSIRLQIFSFFISILLRFVTDFSVHKFSSVRYYKKKKIVSVFFFVSV